VFQRRGSLDRCPGPARPAVAQSAAARAVVPGGAFGGHEVTKVTKDGKVLPGGGFSGHDGHEVTKAMKE